MRRCSVVGIILAVTVFASRAAAGEAVYLGSYVWTSDQPDFGGWSGFDTEADGLRFRAVSDIGMTVAGVLKRDAEGRVTGVAAGPLELMRGDEAELLAKPVRDAEGLAIEPGGAFAVSFEGSGRTARIVRYADVPAAAEILINGTQIEAQSENKGFEGLALAADGTLYGIVEAPSGLWGGHRVYVRRGTEWTQPFEIPRDGTWLVSGADFGPDGQLYVLERDFWPLLGFRSRVLRLHVEDDRIQSSEVLLQTVIGMHDNLEGIAVWTAQDGTTRLTMMSDDNLRRQQRTEIVDYRLVP
jgi:hypothetical protein